MTNQQLEQGILLNNEKSEVRSVANEMRAAINKTSEYPTIPTTGLICNLIALVDVWENQQVEQIDNQFNAL